MPAAEAPRPCHACGYDLRGLPERRACPECGAKPDEPSLGAHSTEAGLQRRPLVDLLDSGTDAERSRLQRGLGLAAFSLMALAFARVASFLANAVAGGSADQVHAVIVLGVASAWTVAVFLLLPPRMTRAWPWMRGVRLAALVTQPLWIVTGLFGVAWAFDLAVVRPWMELSVAAVALAGAVCVTVLMTYMAEEAELDRTQRRLNIVAWGLPFAAVVLSIALAAFPTTMGSIPEGPWGLVSVIFLLPAAVVIGASAWLLGQFAIGLMEMRHHARWGRLHIEEAQGRQERIERKRAELERQALGIVRALPTDKGGEVALGPERASQP